MEVCGRTRGGSRENGCPPRADSPPKQARVASPTRSAQHDDLPAPSATPVHKAYIASLVDLGILLLWRYLRVNWVSSFKRPSSRCNVSLRRCAGPVS